MSGGDQRPSLGWNTSEGHRRLTGEGAEGDGSVGGHPTDGPLREVNNVDLEGVDPYSLGSLTATGLQIERSKADRWIYPKNVPMRRYQADIVETALFHNTLVCLPTGLGKTLIAAVVMYNYYSWFPEGKVIFVAPTKPLVDQQREACLFKVSIAEFDTVELTGRQKPEVRKELWEKKRVFFCTPHIVANDIAKGFCDESKFVCLVVDECHRGVGNYPSVKVVQHLKQSKVKCRIVGLSATPGRTKEVVQEVIGNLMTARVEFRNEEDHEIKMHTHERKVTTITVRSKLQLEEAQHMLHSVMRRIIAPLIDAKVFHSFDVERITRFSLVLGSQRLKMSRMGNAAKLQQNFQQAIFLASLMENLENGIRVAHEFMQTSCEEKPLIKSLLWIDPEFDQLKGLLKQMVDTNTEHPKMQKLVEILQDHFSQEGSLNRVVVFTSLRETVSDVVQALERSPCGASAKKFIGQGGSKNGVGMTQKEQQRILREFRGGEFNTLVATCIGEEGLDIPEVSLIVCYDGAASPIRDTQRMGRTGRHATGNVIYLLSEGRQKEKYDRSKDEASRLHQILRNAEANFFLNPMNPRMIPREFNPKMLVVNMNTVKPEDLQPPQTSGKGRKRSLQKATCKATEKAKSSKTGLDDAGVIEPPKRRKSASRTNVMKSFGKFLEVPNSDDEDLPWNKKGTGTSRHAYQTDDEDLEAAEPDPVPPPDPSMCGPQAMESNDAGQHPHLTDDFCAHLGSDTDHAEGEVGGPNQDAQYGYGDMNCCEEMVCSHAKNEMVGRPEHCPSRVAVDLTDSPPKHVEHPDPCPDPSCGRQQELNDGTPVVIEMEIAGGSGVGRVSEKYSSVESGPDSNNLKSELLRGFPRTEAMEQIERDYDTSYQTFLSAQDPAEKYRPPEAAAPPHTDAPCSLGTVCHREQIDLQSSDPGCVEGRSAAHNASLGSIKNNDPSRCNQTSELDVAPCTQPGPSKLGHSPEANPRCSEKRSKRFWDRPSAVNVMKSQPKAIVTVVCESSDSEAVDLLTPCNTNRGSRAQRMASASPLKDAKPDSPCLGLGGQGEGPSHLPMGLTPSKLGASDDVGKNAENDGGISGNAETQTVDDNQFVTPCRQPEAIQLTGDTTGGSSAQLWNHMRRATQAISFRPSPSILGNSSQEGRSGHQAGAANADEFLDLEAADSDGNPDDSADERGYSDEEVNGFIDNATQPAMMTQISPGSTPNMMAHYHESLLAAQPPTPEFLKRIEQEARNPKELSQDEETAELTGEDEMEDEDDSDVCLICSEGGHLLVCDGCNKPHHPHCVGLSEVPPGDWFCPLCLEYAALLSE